MDQPSVTESSRPIFLVGSVRSGTSMLRLMLEHHPEIACLFESEFLVDRIGPDGEIPNLNSYRAFLDSNRVFRLSGLDVDPDLDFVHLVKSFLEQHKQRCRKPRIGATVHHNFDRLRFLWPSAKYIHLHRDGRAVARSVMKKGWASNMWHGSGRWLEAEETWSTLQPHLSPADRIEIAYEDLVASPKSELTRICQFVGVDYSPKMLSYHEDSIYKLPDASIIELWRKKLSPGQIRLAESRIGKLLKARGYEPVNDPLPQSPSRSKLALLELHNRWGRAKCRSGRYGFVLTASIFWARRLGLQRILASLIRRMEDIEDEYCAKHGG